MSRSKSAADINILDAAEKWKQQCLLDGGSLFSEESLWTRENFDQLRIHFVDNPDEGSRSFYEKLAQQLTPAPPEVKRLWAEMTWVLFLIVYRGVLKPETKRDQIRQVWEWSGSVLPDNHWALGEVLAKGVTNPGQAYNSRRWRECCFFITTMISWFSHSSEDRESLLTDPWDFAEWLGTQDYSPPRPQFQHAFLYFLFPDAFEAIMSQSHKEKIVNAFSKKWNENLLTNDGDNVALDQALLKIRERLQDEYPDTRVDFYSSQFKDIWQSSQPPPPPLPQVKETAPLFASYSIANILAEGCFLAREKLETILQRLRDKKNLILQGPPGTGKTWLAKKLAFAVIGERDEDKIRPVQFHPNLSYEDFVN